MDGDEKMSVKKIIALGMMAGVALSGVAMANVMHPPAPAKSILDPTDTMIVVPTTVSVNGTPLHIKNDAMEAGILAVDMIKMNYPVSMKEVKEKVVVPVRSININDTDQVYTLSKADFSELNLPSNVRVVIDFSKISFNTSVDKSVFAPNAVKILINTSEDDILEGKYSPFMYNDDGKDVLKLFEVMNVTNKICDFKTKYTFGDFSIIVSDYDDNNNNLMVTVGFDGDSVNQILNLGESYVVYKNDDGVQVAPLSSVNLSDIKKTMDKFAVFNIKSVFIGYMGNTNYDIDAKYYEVKKVYKDGDHWDGQNYWYIDVGAEVNGTIPFTIYFDPDNPSTNKTEVYVGNELNIPYENLTMMTYVEYDKDGKYVSHAYYFEQLTEKMATVKVSMPDLSKISDDIIVPDYELTNVTTLPDDNIVVVGGWVSNKFWSVLEKKIGADKIDNVKSEVMSDGYTVKFFKNPDYPDKYIIIVAGKDYKGTAEAVEKLMEMLDEE